MAAEQEAARFAAVQEAARVQAARVAAAQEAAWAGAAHVTARVAWRRSVCIALASAYFPRAVRLFTHVLNEQSSVITVN